MESMLERAVREHLRDYRESMAKLDRATAAERAGVEPERTGETRLPHCKTCKCGEPEPVKPRMMVCENSTTALPRDHVGVHAETPSCTTWPYCRPATELEVKVNRVLPEQKWQKGATAEEIRGENRGRESVLSMPMTDPHTHRTGEWCEQYGLAWICENAVAVCPSCAVIVEPASKAKPDPLAEVKAKLQDIVARSVEARRPMTAQIARECLELIEKVEGKG